jgi:hypothetical protein
MSITPAIVVCLLMIYTAGLLHGAGIQQTFDERQPRIKELETNVQP